MRWGSGSAQCNSSYSGGSSVTRTVAGRKWVSAHVYRRLCLLVFYLVLGSVNRQPQAAVTIFLVLELEPGSPGVLVQPSATELPQSHFPKSPVLSKRKLDTATG